MKVGTAKENKVHHVLTPLEREFIETDSAMVSRPRSEATLAAKLAG